MNSMAIHLYESKIRNLANYIRQANYYKLLPLHIVDAIIHKVRINASIKDYYWFEFYKNNMSWDDKSRYVSTMRSSMYWPYENNSIAYNFIFSDKYIQRSLMKGFGLPIPKLISTIGETLEIRTRDQLNRFLDTIETDFAIKPVNGTSGSDFLALSRDGDRFVAANRSYSKEDLWNHVRKHLRRGVLIEERVRNIGYIAAIYPTALNTFRVITIKTNDHVWHLAACILKFGRGQSQIDNGGAGSIQVSIDDSGKTIQAYDFTHLKAITHHPDTGAPLTGIKLEDYSQVIDLALRASEKFNFMGTLGWDIALSDRGPLIIETNALWESQYVQRTLGRGLITDEIAKGLKKHTLLTRWDKTRMYPGFYRRR